MDLARNTHYLPGINKHLVLQDIQNRCALEVSGPACYRQFRDRGRSYGNAFQTIKHIWLGTHEALGLLDIASQHVSLIADYQLHPVIFDTCFQMLLAIAILTKPREDNREGLYVPGRVDSIRIYGTLTPEMWCYATLSDQSHSPLEGRAVLCDDAGNVLVDIQGIRAKAADTSVSLLPSPLRHPGSWFYDVQWQPTCNLQQEQGNVYDNTDETGDWFIFADENGVGETLASLLEKQGQTYILIFPGETYCKNHKRRYTIRAAWPEDYERFYTEWAEENEQSQCLGVIHLWSQNARRDSGVERKWLQDMQDIGTHAILYLIQALIHANLFPLLWLVTQGTQSVAEETSAGSLAQAPIWGLGRVLYEEYPFMRGALIDLDPTPASDNPALLLSELSQIDGEHQIAFRQNQRYVARLNRIPVTTKTLLPAFRSDVSYLITGGFGALGLLVARWMIQRGARHLLLAGRSMLPPRSAWQSIGVEHPHATHIKHLRELETLGALIYPASLDVTDEEDIAALVINYHQEGRPPIRGVVHAAGVVQDQMLWHMDKKTFDEALYPKMLGGWSLHHCFREIPLDFFLLFSSVASLIATPGQSNYAAGNAFLDALACYRRAQGLPALSVNWGPWAAGMITRANLAEFYEQRGMICISPEIGVHMLEHIFSLDRKQVLAGLFNWSALSSAYPIAPRLIEQLGKAAQGEAVANPEKEEAQRVVRQAQGLERQVIVETFLTNLVARVLRIVRAQLDLEQPLNTLGMDSMLALELKNRIELEMAVNISAVDLLQGASVNKLVAQIIQFLETQE